MAAMVTAAIPVTSAENVVPNTNVAPEDDEKFLYGEKSVKKEPKENGVNDNEAKVNGEVEGENEDDEFEDSDDDDDDDNIQVHIGEVNTTANQYGTPGIWKKDGAAAAAATTANAAKSAAGLLAQGQKKIDVNAVGSINGQPIYEFDMDAEQEEKAWRKPGADISDYFNYGFTEDTWKQYCEKQRRMRMESVRTPYTVTATVAPIIAAPPTVEFEVLPDGRTRVKAGPPPDRKVEGTIHVLGSDDVRRKQKEEELLALALGQPRIMQPAPFPGQRPVYLPGGGMVYGEIPGEGQSSQGQQIQSIGAPSTMTSVMGPGVQYLPAGPGMGMALGPGGHPIFPPPGADQFMHPGNMPPPFGNPRGNSDSEFDSDGETRRHRGRRDSGRHRRHRDRSERDRDRDRSTRERSDRDRSRTEHRDRSSSRRRHESRSTSDRKKHSRSNSVRPDEEEGGERKSSRRRTKVEIKQEPIDDPNTDGGPTETPVPEEPVAVADE